MKRFATILIALVLVLAAAAYAHDMQNMKHSDKTMPRAAAGKSTTMQGEIVDMGCYLDHEASGKDHQSCAQKCLGNGMPMGLLTKDGTLYLLTQSHDNLDPFNQAKQWAAEQVVVTGPQMERHGMKAIEVEQVKLASTSEKSVK